jgi:hypothetical protein
MEVEMRCLRAVAGYRMTDHKLNEYIVGELEMTIIKQQRRLLKEIGIRF